MMHAHAVALAWRLQLPFAVSLKCLLWIASAKMIALPTTRRSALSRGSKEKQGVLPWGQDAKPATPKRILRADAAGQYMQTVRNLQPKPQHESNRRTGKMKEPALPRK